MSAIRSLFATRLYEADLNAERDFPVLARELEEACLMLEAEDEAGRAWSRRQNYGGYTSYASLNDLPVRAPAFADLKKRLDRHAGVFARELAFDLGPRGRLKLDSLWANVLRGGAGHSGHIHPHGVLSGTVYVALPKGAAGLKLEDPRLAMMMAAPTRGPDAPEDLRPFVTLSPEPGTLYLWESWLRHEVPPSRSKAARISISFNFAWT